MFEEFWVVEVVVIIIDKTVPRFYYVRVNIGIELEFLKDSFKSNLSSEKRLNTITLLTSLCTTPTIKSHTGLL